MNGNMKSGRALLAILAFGLIGFGCGGDRSENLAVDRDTLTRRQKDSIIAESPLPGAGVVGKALDASEAASVRAQAHDTIH